MKNIFLSVVIPAYNEVGNLKKGVLRQVVSYLKDRDYTWEVIVVDDGSTDKTVSLVKTIINKNKSVKILEEPHRGKAGAVIAGMLAAKGEIVLFSDMDQATPIDQIENFLPKFEEGYDIVIGSRSGRKGAPVVRKIMAFGFAALRTLILRLPYKDTQCGFKAFNGNSAKQIFRKLRVFKENQSVEGASVFAGFDLEILYIARKLKLKVAEVPVKWQHIGTVRVNPFKDSWEGFRDMIKVRLNAFLGKYK